MYINNIPYRSQISTNDYDITIKNLLKEIIEFHQKPSNHDDYDAGSNFSYLSYMFKFGKVIDNYGIDFNKNNLQILDNITETDFLVTYRRDNKLLYRDCVPILKYWIVIKLKDCPANYARLNTIADVILDSMINNKSNFTYEFTSEFTNNNGQGKKNKYQIRLDNIDVLERYDSIIDSHNSKNYIYTTLQIETYITKVFN
jgi:hypothetical protein